MPHIERPPGIQYVAALAMPSAVARRRPRSPLTPEQQEQSRQRSRLYYLKHKDKVIAKAKARYDDNRDDERARRRDVYAIKKARQSLPSTDASCAAEVGREPKNNALSIQFLLN
ncbi:hypothetical protein SPRG_12898 [Saprolegnia parasitica CBS 223.65]|uniref:Uncharacterized protein n=1 Tax=Saprolegnia parasitica (strain CBS 223.65) TaxID=695850 RepID=A0A067C542_SAPPC|nr:hypothetical protein SPRG_12898 [Saprolegnia parasitica CBS 223.65]KDO21656.1 hypothetical protein SPRG_12898 [Saprolegnia parasitica CBS 223.65]|eukprot:XP_012207666.1 hypothetical protein SPRG_12898 [Saprolegnia parasitica CBS 223.65]